MLHGELERGEVPFCPACGQKMHIHGSRITMLRHLCFGSRLSAVSFEKRRYRCPCCGYTEMESVPFKAAGHNITRELLQFARDLLAYGFTNKEVSELTGLGKNTVKEIDLQRLKDKYTVDGKTLIKPEKQARFLGVDEFKLHNGYKYASLIIDMESGHILWLAHGKRKRTVYDFIDHVGEAWMDGVEAVACDMNSDFQEAFEERCPHIRKLDEIIQRLYEDNLDGKVSDERFARMTATYEQEQKGLETRVLELRDIISKAKVQRLNIDSFLTQVKKYTEVKELDAEIIRSLVERIDVFKPEKIPGIRTKKQTILIHWNFIGAVDLPQEQKKSA